MCVYRGESVKVGCYSVCLPWRVCKSWMLQCVFTVVSLSKLDVTVCVYHGEPVRVGCYSVCLPW